MNRRALITLLGGAAAWPLAAARRAAARANSHASACYFLGPAEVIRTVDPALPAFLQGPRRVGWTRGPQNARIEYRWGVASAIPTSFRKHATERCSTKCHPSLLAARPLSSIAPGNVLDPDRICRRYQIRLARGSSTVWRGRAATSLASASLSSAWQGNGWSCSSRSRPVPDTRGGHSRYPTIASGIGEWNSAIQTAAPSFVSPAQPNQRAYHPTRAQPSRSSCASPNGGLILTSRAQWRPSSSPSDHPARSSAQTTRHLLPKRLYVADGGLISYGYPITSTKSDERPVGRRPHPQGGEAWPSARAGANQIRNGDQPKDCQGTRPGNPSDPARPRRRGDRVTNASRLHWGNR